MLGRNGPDSLTVGSFVSAVILSSFRNNILNYLSLALVAYCIFRMLSKNVTKRRSESEKFMMIVTPVQEWVTQKVVQIKYAKTHKFFKCPSCKNILRVPRGRGKIHITCPKCGQRFDGKS
jgi:predicted RNA-binding Zn-ribbon protein involved in translation (DUF1610 family)